MLPQFLVGFGFAVVVSVVAYFIRYLTFSGAVAAVIIGTLIFGGGGLPWSVPLLVFFFSSSILSKRGLSNNEPSPFEKTSTRDAGQVIANGGVGALLIVLTFFLSDSRLYGAYLGSLATATADTWATEIGMRGKGKTVSLTSFQPVPMGTSGGVSIVGTVGGIFGAVALSLSALWWIKQALMVVPIIVLSGFLGMMVDSVAGATVQAQYRCAQCGRFVEGPRHCGASAIFQRGLPWLTNDWVNVAGSLSGAIAAWFLDGVVQS